MTEYFLDMLKSHAENGCFKAACAVAGGAASYVLGGFDRSLQALFMLIVLDYAFGFAKAWKYSEISATKMRLGTLKVIWYFGALAVLNQIDCAVAFQAGDRGESLRNLVGNGSFSLRNLVALYMCVHEALSALGHLHALGVQMPPWLIPRLRAFRDCRLVCDPKKEASNA